MESKAQIEMDFNKAKIQADKLERIANDLKKISNVEFNDALQKLSNSWQGQNADFYLKKANILQDKMLDTRKNLLDVAERIQTNARRIYKAELIAIEIAEKEG